MANFQEIAGQTSQGINGYNRLITIKSSELTAGAGVKQDFEFVTLKGVSIEKIKVVHRGLRFTAGHANKGSGTGLTAIADLKVSIGTTVAAPVEYAAAQSIYVSGDNSKSGKMVDLTMADGGKAIAFDNSDKLRVQFPADSTHSLNTASAGTIYILLAIVDWKDLDAMANAPTYSGR